MLLLARGICDSANFRQRQTDNVDRDYQRLDVRCEAHEEWRRCELLPHLFQKRLSICSGGEGQCLQAGWEVRRTGQAGGSSSDRYWQAQRRPNSDASAEMVTIEGLVRDVACPIQNKEATARRFNLKCAQGCAKLGSPLIVLTDDGTLYTPISESMPDTDQRQRLMPFLGKYVRVRGQVFERAGTHAIAIKEIVELKEVPLITDAK